ncbi:MAG: hypothetical protein MR992_01845 [Lachnospiraceae bacterium]|nr:hypothetical protein [Lachnospiraceae bacterium]MCI7189615.1 hypothetical protein [Lachnospiraceae bacterium]MDD7628442.1 hypothetical protein [Lachnospiraceae bacterium]MDY4119968.1 hypothetical protein [Lachnospiraceae bacterium]
MCVLLGPNVVINNAFFAKRNDNLSFIEMKSLREFCNILYDKITNSDQKGNRSQYVCFKVDNVDLDDFFDSNSDYARGIDRIYKLKDIGSDELDAVNSIYSEDIQMSLKDARAEFAQMN